MAKWVNSAVLDGGLNEIKNNCNSMRLISAYTAGDSYATVNTNTLASVSMSSGDFTLGTGSANARTLTTASGKSDASADASGGGATNHIAFVDTVSSPARVLWVTEETSGQAITAGNQVNFPSLVYTSNQPT